MKFENEELNKDINVDWTGIVFVEQTRYIPTTAEQEVTNAVISISDALCTGGDIESVVQREHSRIVKKYSLNENDSKKILEMIKENIDDIE